ncbi:hypothetical protein B9T31_03390 [Acinetobacter sp. ANC 4558]|uniref:copper resistance protein NlpE n=1 Tax=Acinetobacter sp. ANC 4558 TaxID=1977876 RepID=UPI000A33E189|nr:copper resistance protein NlpE [Acinetobacter sp. ANC 4558]OTG87782.1 hypothetical protein B9T31_03390 [Acinetobacter sp. ANC 4558]
MKKSAFILSILAISLAACSKQKDEVPTSSHSEATASQAAIASEVAPPTGDTAETSLDWAGEYKGTLPCADCEGIKTELTLNHDKTYELTREYIGSKNSDNKTTTKGKFTFDAHHPSTITLDAPEDNRKIFVSENYILFLDQNGDKITGPLADHYKLTKE